MVSVKCKYNIYNVIICIATDDYSNIDVIDVKSERVRVILNLITYIIVITNGWTIRLIIRSCVKRNS